MRYIPLLFILTVAFCAGLTVLNLVKNFEKRRFKYRPKNRATIAQLHTLLFLRPRTQRHPLFRQMVSR